MSSAFNPGVSFRSRPQQLSEWTSAGALCSRRCDVGRWHWVAESAVARSGRSPRDGLPFGRRFSTALQNETL